MVSRGSLWAYWRVDDHEKTWLEFPAPAGRTRLGPLVAARQVRLGHGGLLMLAGGSPLTLTYSCTMEVRSR